MPLKSDEHLRPHLRDCVQCGARFAVSPLLSSPLCPRCVKWSVIARDMDSANDDTPGDSAEWEAAL